MKIIYGKDTKEQIKAGIDALADVVKTTLGGKGKNVILENQFGKIQIINDGTTIANHVELESPILNAGATLAKQVAAKTNEESGDGTTTSIVLLQAFLSEMEKVKSKDSRGLREEIKVEVDKVVAELDKMKRKVSHKDIERIAYISSLDKEISKAVASLIKKIGKDGVVSIEESKAVGISTEIVNGVRVDRGYVTQLMSTDSTTLKAELMDTAVLVSKKKISVIADMMPIMQHLAANKKNRLAVFCEDISEEVLSMLILNKVQGQFLTLVVKTNDLDDIATVTGAKVITDQNNLGFEPDQLGNAGKIVATRYHTTVMDGKVDPVIIKEKIDELKALKENEEIPYEKDKLAQRIARLQGGVSIIKIGGENEQETYEKKLKLEDAVNAVKAAQEDGIIVGGGLALYRIATKMLEPRLRMEDVSEATNLVAKVILTPIKQILSNAEEDIDERLSKMLDGQGYNVVTRQFEDFFESGVIDPVKVTKSAVKNAFAMGMQILTAESAIVIKREEQK